MSKSGTITVGNYIVNVTVSRDGRVTLDLVPTSKENGEGAQDKGARNLMARQRIIISVHTTIADLVTILKALEDMTDKELAFYNDEDLASADFHDRIQWIWAGKSYLIEISKTKAGAMKFDVMSANGRKSTNPRKIIVRWKADGVDWKPKEHELVERAIEVMNNGWPKKKLTYAMTVNADTMEEVVATSRNRTASITVRRYKLGK